MQNWLMNNITDGIGMKYPIKRIYGKRNQNINNINLFLIIKQNIRQDIWIYQMMKRLLLEKLEKELLLYLYMLIFHVQLQWNN